MCHRVQIIGKTFEQLITENENFVYYIVNKEFKKYSWNIKEDLYSAGKEGLVYAATKFKPSYDNKFTSYAVNWIRYYIYEELCNMHPVKMNQTFLYKAKKIKNFIATYKKANGYNPTTKEISKALNITEKVINNTLKINNGEEYQFVSLQAGSNKGDNSDDSNSESFVENKLINEYLETTVSDSSMINYELQDMLNALKAKVSEKDYNMFIDKHLNGLSFSDIAKKYGLNFPSSSKYIIERTEKVCKRLIS